MSPLDSLQTPPYFIGPTNRQPAVLVDEYRNILMDPTDNSMVGYPGTLGAAGHLGRLVYAQRTPSSRGY